MDRGGATARGFDYRTVVAIGAGSTGLAVVWSIYNAYMPLLLGEFVESRALRGAIMGIDNVLALALIPVIGAWSDGLRGPLGKRLPFIAVGMPLAALLFVALPWATWALWTLLVVDIVFLLAITSFRAPVIALMPDHVPPEGRSTANGVINLMAGLGGIVAFVLIAPLFDRAAQLPFALAGAALLATFALVWRFADRHPPYVEEGAASEDARPLRTLLEDTATLVSSRDRGPVLVLLAIFVYLWGFAAMEAHLSIYATETLGLTGGRVGVLLGAFAVTFVATAIPAGILGRRWGKARTMLAGLICLPAVFLVASRLHDPAALATAFAVAGAAWALVNVQAYALVADQGGRDRIGFFTGMYYVAGSAAAILAPGAIGALMDAFGNVALFYASATAFALGAFTLSLAQRRLRSSRRVG